MCRNILSTILHHYHFYKRLYPHAIIQILKSNLILRNTDYYKVDLLQTCKTMWPYVFLKLSTAMEVNLMSQFGEIDSTHVG